MKAFPIRLFHAIVSGLVLGTILSIASLQLFQHSAAQETGGSTSGSSGQTTSPPPPAPPVLNPTPDDLDGDGMPNTWETQFNHDPNNSADASSDFDNDGLTARQEWQLSVSTSGACGNPLGHWSSETLQPPAELGIQYFYPQDINRNGEILLNCGMMTDGFYHDGAVLVDAEGNWTVIRNPSAPADGYIWCSDLNDNGDVVGTWSSSDWSAYEGFCWSQAHGYEVCQLNGERAFPARINNRGDWVGSIEDSGGSWRPAYVVNGVNMHSDRDWWPYVWYQDINDFGEALGAYYTAGYQSQHAFLAYGPWLHDTGLQGSEPEFDPNTYSWSYTVAMNSWGEFTAGSGGQRNGAWSYPGYVFDGEFREIRSPRLAPYYLYPSSISDDKTVAGWAANSSWSYYGFVHRDGVTLRIDELIPGANGGNGAFVSGNRRIVALSADQQSVIVVAPDQDQDGDGMPDDWEKYYGFNPALIDSNADADGDGTNNLGEFLLRSDPNAAPVYDPNGNVIDLRPGIDTDGDGIPNVWEWENGLNYADPSDAPLDFDRDGYTNLQEFRLNTDPRGAPSYCVREVGPFPGASSVSLTSAVLGDGVASFSYAGPIGANVTESVFFPAKPTAAADGGQRPAAWSLLRSASGGSLSFTPSHGSQYTNPVAQAPGGASLCYVSGSPTQFVYWATPTSASVMLSGASSANDISYLYNAKLSPSGNFLVATRSPASASGVYQPIIWKMPLSGTATFKPVRLIPPAGVTLSDWPELHVSDYGHVVATGNIGGQNRPILWTINATGTAVASSILPPLPGGNWASVTGISNQSSPLICGTSAISGGQSRATVWNASGIATSLGTLPGGNYSTATVISRGGKIAGLSNVLVGNTLKYQPFLASYDPATATWKLQAQGTVGSYAPSLLSVNDSGEILGRVPDYSPVYRQISCLWRHGRAYPLDAAIPASSGYSLDTIKAINPNGTLLATTWKDGAQMTVILTPDSDIDGDGLPDAFENQHAFNVYVKNNPVSDSDSDGLTDLDEYRNGTQPRNPDTDNDGMKDGWEVSWGLLPLDPSDAALDPDGDHVTNLRESQIGTNPTGIYKVETLPLGANTKFYTAGDDGSVIVQQSEADEWTPNNTFDYISAPDLTGQRSTTSLYQNWSMVWGDEYSWYEEGLWLSYHNPGDGTVNAIAWDFSESWDVNYGFASNWNDIVLLPDCTDLSSNWISQNTISAELASGGHLGAETEATVSGGYPNYLVSPGGKACVMRTASGKNVVVNQQGQFIKSLPDGTWQLINDQGTAIQFQTRYILAANGVPRYYAPELYLSSGQIIPIPNIPGETPDYTLLKLSNDGKVLLSRTVKTAQLVSYTRYFLFDIATQALTRVKQPGIGSEMIVSLSNEKGRLLGTGFKPFQTTPDGTCIRLDALRIKNTPGETPTPYGTLYPKSLTPNHIASDGTITVTTTDNSGQTVILQIVPHNDADDDGVPDDWEKDYAAQLLTYGQIDTLEPSRKAELLAGNLDSEFDYARNGVKLGAVFAAQQNPQSLTPNPTGMRFEMQQKGIQGLAWEITDQGAKYYAGFYNTHGMNSGGTGGGYFGWFDSAEKLPTVKWTKDNTDSQDFDHVVNPLMGLGSIGMGSIQSWHKTYQGSNFVNYRVKNEKRRIRIWGSKLVATEDVTVNFVKAVFYQPDPQPQWDVFTFEEWHNPMPASAILESAEAVKIKIPKGKTCSEWNEYETPLVEGRAYKVFLLPVEVVELSPKVHSEANETVAIPGSEIPQILPESNPLVERDPLHDITDASTRRIAWRDLKVKIGSELSNKTVSWRMTPQFTPHIELGSPTNIGEMITVPDPNGPRFRGSWEHAENEAHQDAFSASEDYGSSYNWNRRTATTGSTPGEATTKVHEDGYTAIRVNVPPIGFNKARVAIQIEGSSNWIDLIDLEVPAVVVIDPGHGGIEPDAIADKIAAGYTKNPVTREWTLGGSAANHATAEPSKTLEKNMALDCGRLLRDRLKKLSNDQHLHLKLKMTRDSDDNLRLATRANFARDYGADHLLSIHFNGFDKSVRGCEVHVDKTGNLNKPEDSALAERVDAAVFAALHGADNGAVDRHARDDRGLDVLSDPDLGNITSYTPCRAVLLEIEYIDVAAVDRLLNTGGNHQQVRQSVMNGVADAQLSDLRTQPAN